MEDVKIYNFDNDDVNPIQNRDYEDVLANTEKKQDLPGFDEEYLDLPDYILKITHRIWEEKGVGVIYDTYSNNCQVHTGDGTNVGIAGVIAGTLGTLHSFPDRRLIAEDVVWSEDAPGKYLSSHRIISTATNLGDSSFGPATGKKLYFRTIADCECANNYIFEEWLARDNWWMCDQLGVDAEELGKKMAAGKPAKKTAGMDECMEGQFTPKAYKAKDESEGEKLKEMLNDIYNRKMINRVCDYYTDNAVVHTVRNQTLIGHDQIQGNIVSLLSSFPNAKFTVDRITCNKHSEDGSVHASVRWWLRGRHDGLGTFGAPTGKQVDILGITQYRFVEGKIVEAWEVYDGLDVYRQIHLGDETPVEE